MRRDNEKLLYSIIEQLDLPKGAYEKAVERYEDLGDWFNRENSNCREYEPHIFPQGSFRLGTAIRPINQSDEYDIDLACKLRKGISENTHTQAELKNIIGEELEHYKVARNIQSQLESKHRCWRLNYADTISFHMDIVPCVPKNENVTGDLVYSIEEHNNATMEFSESIAAETIAITDDRESNYRMKPSEWLISNPEGYARWFESRNKPSSIITLSEEARIDDIPEYHHKTPLQRAIQLLKRHRDKMFEDTPDSKPISVIITTLVTQNYKGEVTVEGALNNALRCLNDFAMSGATEVKNPVNPEENFADKWLDDNYKHLNLKESFVQWTVQAGRDFNVYLVGQNLVEMKESISDNLSVELSLELLNGSLGTVTATEPILLTNVDSKPWAKLVEE